MKKILIIIFAIIVVIGIVGEVLLFVLRPKQPSQNSTNNFQPLAKNSQEEIVIIKDLSFQPDNLTIKKGTIVTWINEDDLLHHIINTPNGDIFESNDLKKGERYSFTFNESGNYDYYCKIYPVAAGKIVVVED